MPPRASLRQRTATPARSTRASTAFDQGTPATRRSTRAAQSMTTAQDTVTNPALPEIQTQQSYAYGASKAPALPEQIQARDMSMRAVASRLDEAREAAEANFEARAAEFRGTTPKSQASTRNGRVQTKVSRHSSQELPPINEETPALNGKLDRTAAWVESSMDDPAETFEVGEHEDDEAEEDGGSLDDRGDREDTAPSSFPSGIFDHSYNYERGLRNARVPTSIPPPARSDKRTTPPLASISVIRPQENQLQKLTQAVYQSLREVSSATSDWITRLLKAIQKSILDFPESNILTNLLKFAAVATIFTAAVFSFCSSYHYLCEADSQSIVSQSLSKLCGRCTNPPTLYPSPLNFTSIDGASDISVLLSALQQTQSQIQRLESRINSVSSIQNHDISTLRTQQDALETQLRRLRSHPSGSDSSIEIASPLLRRINFFSPSNGALIDPHLTSPTRQKQPRLASRLLSSLLRLDKMVSRPPITALLAWQDEDECWCAAPPAGSIQKETTTDTSLRLGIDIPHMIFPTELVVEHLPSTSSLLPGTTPRDIELWADFGHLSIHDFHATQIPDLIANSGTIPNFGRGETKGLGSANTWARIATAEYVSTQPLYSTETGEEIEMRGRGREHVQRFGLDVNQNGLVHSARRFVVRVTSNYGGEWTCLYRVRLHGMTVEQVEEFEELK